MVLMDLGNGNLANHQVILSLCYECNLKCLGFLAAATANKVNDDEYGVPGRVGGEVGGHQVRDERKESLCAPGKSHGLFSFTR